MFKAREQKKQQQEQEQFQKDSQEFLNAFQEFSKTQKCDFAAALKITEQGIAPAFKIVYKQAPPK